MACTTTPMTDKSTNTPTTITTSLTTTDVSAIILLWTFTEITAIIMTLTQVIAVTMIPILSLPLIFAAVVEVDNSKQAEMIRL